MNGQNLLCEHEDEASTILQWRMDENSDETTILTVQSFLLALLGEKNIWGFFKGPGFLRRHMNRSPTLADVFFFDFTRGFFDQSHWFCPALVPWNPQSLWNPPCFRYWNPKSVLTGPGGLRATFTSWGHGAFGCRSIRLSPYPCW